MSGAIPVLPPICFHGIHRDNFFVLFIFIYLLQFFKDTVTISNCIMSDSRIIVKCLWLDLMYHSSICLGQQTGHAIPRSG